MRKFQQPSHYHVIGKLHRPNTGSVASSAVSDTSAEGMDAACMRSAAGLDDTETGGSSSLGRASLGGSRLAAGDDVTFITE